MFNFTIKTTDGIEVTLYCPCLRRYINNANANVFWSLDEFDVLTDEEAKELQQNHKCRKRDLVVGFVQST